MISLSSEMKHKTHFGDTFVKLQTWNNHIFLKLQTLKSCSFLYSASSYGYIIFVLNSGIAPTTHKPINFFFLMRVLHDSPTNLDDILWLNATIAWTIEKPTHISFFMQVLHDSTSNPNNILWFQHLQLQPFIHNILLN